MTKYLINIEYPDEKLGSISASAQRAIEGTEISLTAAPKEGYEFAGWRVLGTDNTTIAVSDDKFTMPAQDVFISASFNLIDYSITKNVSDNGSFIVKKLDGSEATTAHKGDVITLWATPDEGYVFNEWIIKDDAGMSVSVNYNKFTMPASNVTISASFKLKPVVTYEHAGTAEDPYNIADVIKLISTLGTEISSEVYAKGIIRSIKEVSTEYGNATYSIGDDSSSEVIDVFRGKYLNGTKFTSNDQIQVEDEIVVKGKVQDYKGAKQFCVNNQIVSLKRIEPCATPVITIAEDGTASITCATAGATIHYTVGENPADPTETDAVFSTVTLTDGQTIKAIAVAEGFKPSAVALKKYVVGGEAPKTYTLQFGKNYNSTSIQNYTSTWSVTCDGFTWDMVNWNNNQNDWNYVKAVRKNVASVATITTKTAMPEAISTVTMTIDAIKKVNSIKMEVISATGTTIETITGTKATGECLFKIANPQQGCKYKITVDCAKGENGSIQVSKVVYTN